MSSRLWNRCGTQSAPFSIDSTRRSGLRDSAPWQISANIECSIGNLPIAVSWNGVGLNGVNSLDGSQIRSRSAYPLSDPCIETGMSAAMHACQNGSNSSNPNGCEHVG